MSQLDPGSPTYSAVRTSPKMVQPSPPRPCDFAGVGAPHTAPRPVPVDARWVMALQGAVGNRAVQRLLADNTPAAPTNAALLKTKPATATATTVQRQSKPRRASQAANIARLTTLRNNAETRFTVVSDYSAESLAVGDLTRDKLSAISQVYTPAYNTFRGVLNSAQLEAQNQQRWTDIVVGIVCGTAAGLAAAFVLPSTAAGWFSLTLAEVGTAAASSAGQGILSATLAAVASGTTDVAGKTISSEGLQPMFRELAMWRAVANIYRSGLEITPLSRASHTLTVRLSDVIADVRVFEAGGTSTLTDARINETITSLERPDGQLTPVPAELGQKLTELRALKAAVAAINPQARSTRQIERDIWTMWMSTLAYNSNILDLDVIEDHIGPNGLGIVNFGRYTSDADENEAIGQARDNTRLLEAEAHQAEAIEDRSRQLRILTL